MFKKKVKIILCFIVAAVLMSGCMGTTKTEKITDYSSAATTEQQETRIESLQKGAHLLIDVDGDNLQEEFVLLEITDSHAKVILVNGFERKTENAYLGSEAFGEKVKEWLESYYEWLLPEVKEAIIAQNIDVTVLTSETTSEAATYKFKNSDSEISGIKETDSRSLGTLKIYLPSVKELYDFIEAETMSYEKLYLFGIYDSEEYFLTRDEFEGDVIIDGIQVYPCTITDSRVGITVGISSYMVHPEFVIDLSKIEYSLAN